MAEHDYERELGGINANLETIIKQQDGIFQRLNEISTDGCAKGKQNSKAIHELQTKPERTVAIVASIAAILAAVVAWMKT